MNQPIIKKNLIVLLMIVGGIFAACNQSSRNHDENTYSNGNQVTDSSTRYNTDHSASNNSNTNTSVNNRPTTATDTARATTR